MDSGQLGTQYAQGDGGQLADSNNVPKKKRRPPEKPWKKPKDMPKRPLSAYNLFFKDERERIKSAREAEASSQVDSVGDSSSSTKAKSGLGFAKLAKTIAKRWKELDSDTKAPYEKQAAVDKERYEKAVAIWREEQRSKKDQLKKQAAQAMEVSESTDGEPPGESNKSSEPLDDISCHTPTSHSGYPSDWFESDGPSAELTPIQTANGDSFLMEPTSPLTLEWTGKLVDPNGQPSPYIIHNNSNLQQRLHENHMQQLQEQQMLLQMQSQQLQQQYQENQEMQKLLLHNQQSQAFIFHNNQPAPINSARPSRQGSDSMPQYMPFITTQDMPEASGFLQTPSQDPMMPTGGMLPSASDSGISANVPPALAPSVEDFSMHTQSLAQDSAFLKVPSPPGVGTLDQLRTPDAMTAQSAVLDMPMQPVTGQGAPTIGQMQDLDVSMIDLTQLPNNANRRGSRGG